MHDSLDEFLLAFFVAEKTTTLDKLCFNMEVFLLVNLVKINDCSRNVFANSE